MNIYMNIMKTLHKNKRFRIIVHFYCMSEQQGINGLSTEKCLGAAQSSTDYLGGINSPDF